MESRQSMKKVRIDVEGSMGPYYKKQRIHTRNKEGEDKTRELVVGVIPPEVSVSLTVIIYVFENGGTTLEASSWQYRRGIRFGIRFRANR